MPIKYGKIDILEKSEGLFSISVKITVDDFNPPYEKIVPLDYRPDRPHVFEKNLAIQTDEFISEIKKTEAIKAIDVSQSLAKVAVTSSDKYKDIAKAVIK